MSVKNTNRDIRRFETDTDGNTTRVVLNTDEPLGLLEGDFQAQIDALTERLNSIVGIDNIVKITNGGTGQSSTQDAMHELTENLDTSLFEEKDAMFFLKRVDGFVVTQTISEVIDILGGLEASSNLSDLSDTLIGLQNLYHDIPIAETEGGIPLKDWFDELYVMLGRKTGYSDYTIKPNRYTLAELVQNYLSEYFCKKTGNLSELQSANEAIKNLLDRATSLSGFGGSSEIMANNAGIPQLRTGGKITVSRLTDYIFDGFNTEYGMKKNSGTEKYEFTGDAATAKKAATTETELIDYNGSPGGRVEFGLYSNSSSDVFLYSNVTGVNITIPLTYGVTGNEVVILTGVNCTIVDGYGEVTIKSYEVKSKRVLLDDEVTYSSDVDITFDVTSSSPQIAIRLRFNALYYVGQHLR